MRMFKALVGIPKITMSIDLKNTKVSVFFTNGFHVT